MAIKFTPITDTLMHGSEAEQGNRKGQAVLAYSACGSWLAFFYLDGKLLHMGKRTDGREYITHKEALAEVRAYLKGEPLPYENDGKLIKVDS